MSIWTDAAAEIDAAFADPELVIYTGAGLDGAALSAIWSDVPAFEFQGPGNTLRRVTYEFAQADFPQAPRKTNSFTHRGRLWSVEDITRRDDIAKWELVVVDSGAAP